MDELCGVMLSIGMSYDLYWYGDMSAIQYYIDKHTHEVKQLTHRNDENAWLIGNYVRYAIASVFDSKHQSQYPKEPFTYQKVESEEDKIIRQYNMLKAWSDRFKKKGRG